MNYYSNVFALVLLMSSAAALSQPDTPSSNIWYTVELLVFENTAAVDLVNEEMPLLPILQYPERLDWLHQGDTERALDNGLMLKTLEQTAPQSQAFNLAWERSIEQLYDTQLHETQLHETQLRLNLERSKAPDVDPVAIENEAANPFEVRLPVSFALLPDEQREYNSERRRIHRRADMNVLFHEAWRQPITSRANARNIIIQSTPQYDYPQLQGSILLYVSRYLHLETKLWLNTVTDALPDGWNMPAPPLPPSPTEDNELPFKVELERDFAEHSELQAIDTSLLPAKLVATESGVEAWNLNAFIEQTYYQPFNQAILMNQRRRMRSGELHYIDHPRIGLLIKLTPYEFDPFPPTAAEIEPTGG